MPDGLTREEEIEIDDFFTRLMEDPEFVRILAQEREKLDRCYQVPCPWGTCEISIDPLTNRIEMSIGVVGCPCDNTRGWRSKYYQGLGKPGWNAKPYGRHGGKIAKSRRQVKDLERWRKECFT